MKKVLKPFKFGTMKTAADFEKTMTEAGLPFRLTRTSTFWQSRFRSATRSFRTACASSRSKALTVSRTEAPPISSAAATRDTPAAARA